MALSCGTKGAKVPGHLDAIYTTFCKLPCRKVFRTTSLTSSTHSPEQYKQHLIECPTCKFLHLSLDEIIEANVNGGLKKLVRERTSQTGDSICSVEDIDSDPKHVNVRFYGTADDIVSIRFKTQGLEKLNSFRILLSGHDANVTYVLWNVYFSPKKVRSNGSLCYQTDLWNEIRRSLAENTSARAVKELGCLQSLPSGALLTHLPKHTGIENQGKAKRGLTVCCVVDVDLCARGYLHNRLHDWVMCMLFSILQLWSHWWSVPWTCLYRFLLDGCMVDYIHCHTGASDHCRLLLLLWLLP